MNKKILIVTSKFPWPVTGASESDRASGIKQLIRLGYDVRVITKVTQNKIDSVGKVADDLGIPIYPVPYRKINLFIKYVKMNFSKKFIPDSAAYEYNERLL